LRGDALETVWLQLCGGTSDGRAMQRGYNKGLQQLAKIKNAVPVAARLCKVPRSGAPCAGAKTCTHLELHHPSGGVLELPPAVADNARSRLVSISARQSLWTASGTCEQRTRQALRRFASATTLTNQPADPFAGE
jgi:uncharacterized protein